MPLIPAKVLVSREVDEDNMNIIRNVMDITPASMVTRLVQKPRNSLTTSHFFGALRVVIKFYSLYKYILKNFRILLQQSNEFVWLKQQGRFFETRRQLLRPDGVVVTTKKPITRSR